MEFFLPVYSSRYLGKSFYEDTTESGIVGFNRWLKESHEKGFFGFLMFKKDNEEFNLYIPVRDVIKIESKITTVFKKKVKRSNS